MPSLPGLKFFRNLVERRTLLFQLVRRDFEQRFVGSAAGWLWGLIHPLVLLLSWTFVFQWCLKVTLPPRRDHAELHHVPVHRLPAVAVVPGNGDAFVHIAAGPCQSDHQNRFPGRAGARLDLPLVAGKPPDDADDGNHRRLRMAESLQRHDLPAAAVHAVHRAVCGRHRMDRGELAGLFARYVPGHDGGSDAVVLGDPDLHYRGSVPATGALGLDAESAGATWCGPIASGCSPIGCHPLKN